MTTLKEVTIYLLSSLNLDRKAMLLSVVFNDRDYTLRNYRQCKRNYPARTSRHESYPAKACLLLAC